MSDDDGTELVGKATDSLVDIGLALAAHYFSTYCLHDRHLECRLRCKTCGKPCRCGCHGSAEDQRRTEEQLDARRARQFAAREQLATQAERSDRWRRSEEKESE